MEHGPIWEEIGREPRPRSGDPAADASAENGTHYCAIAPVPLARLGLDTTEGLAAPLNLIRLILFPPHTLGLAVCRPRC